MEKSNQTKGSVESFDENWKKQDEALYTHWLRGEPQNQIQLAFRQHFELFQELIHNPKKKLRVLEVGCGRGSLSSYFADTGHDCTLIDLSEHVMEIAEGIFKANDLKAKFFVGDANNMPFDDNSFDLIFSIGLLEHFEDVNQVIGEQIRVLDHGGTFIGYVVPENKDNIQKDFAWINQLLMNLASTEQKGKAQAKSEVYRSDEGSPRYINACEKFGLKDVKASGTYPLPMISYSPEFPFTLLDSDSERVLVNRFNEILNQRRIDFDQHPWLCDESLGQAFLVWGRK